jgi:signal transduction histidine kinase
MADTIVANIDELKSVELLRRELIANVSHDLRTPLTIMQGYVETLRIKNDKLSEGERDKYLGIVQHSIENLSKLINQLFEYSKLEARQIEPHKEPFSISDLAQDVYEKYQNLASSKNIEINLEAESNVPMVFADISLVERVIHNLMDNAIKFTPDGGIVNIQIKSDPNEVYVSIKDSGPGISEEDQQYIFERFKRVDKFKDANVGAGLGLAIAKKIIEIHNSNIGVISRPNQGTTFKFNLPMYVA